MSAEVQRVVHGEGATMVVIMEMNSGDGMTVSRHGCEPDYQHGGEMRSRGKKKQGSARNGGGARKW